MTKRDIVMRISYESEMKQQDIALVVQKTLDYITNELAAGRTVELRNFGVFEVASRQSRVGRNPNKPDDTVIIPKRAVVKFKPGKIMKEKLSKINPDKL